MKQDKRDRRSQRTRHLITTAMLELVFEQHYETITVQDILDRAGIGRSTFYTHFFDKEDVLSSIAEQMLEMFRQQLSQRKEGGTIVPVLEMFEHVQQHEQYFRAMSRGHTGEVFWEAAQIALSKTIEQALSTVYAENASPAISWAVIAQYLTGSLLTLLKWWLKAEMPYSPEQMEKIFQQLALPGVWATVGAENTSP
ncbi:TetR family transcriptional regulator [Reticulibacter mediterranei]|uniref:TetR family transcriptional regulator n=1 Tax=Reticulibacter mediterranei TaxID=2778369 RepID=A0A8J3N8U1_9CHLR|nr:TetR/AcrR family transcriptional regulator [Reticulibacter mediterranei]GHO99895.1 TetR family transcriptional regulator [Reticulibacter mediterranei]